MFEEIFSRHRRK